MSAPVADPFLPGQRLATRAGEPPSYQEVPGGALTTAQREFALAVTARVEAINSWKTALTRVVMPNDLIRYRDGRLTNTAADASVNLGGPSGQISAFILRSDHAAPSIPGDVVWGGTTAPLTPRELIALTTVSHEQTIELIGFDLIVDGAPVANTRTAFTPLALDELAEAIARKEASEFITGAGTTVDPINGLATVTTTTQASTSSPYIDDAVLAIENLRGLGRFPNGIFISPSLARIWRQAKGTGGGSYLFNPSAPMSLAGVEVFEHYGIAAGASIRFYVGDWKKYVMMHRILPGGMLYKVDWTSDGADFNTDQTTFRVFTRWDANLAPGYSAKHRRRDRGQRTMTTRVARGEAPIGRATALRTTADLRADLLRRAREIGTVVAIRAAAGNLPPARTAAEVIGQALLATRTAAAAEFAADRYPLRAVRSATDDAWVEAQLAKRRAYARNVLAPLLGIEPDEAEAAAMSGPRHV